MRSNSDRLLEAGQWPALAEPGGGTVGGTHPRWGRGPRSSLFKAIDSGIGNLKAHLPGAVATDLFPSPWLDLACDGYELPFRPASLSHLVLFDVFHPEGWKVFHAEGFSCFYYLLSGGYSKPAFYPARWLEIIRRFEAKLSRCPRAFGGRCLLGLAVQGTDHAASLGQGAHSLPAGITHIQADKVGRIQVKH